MTVSQNYVTGCAGHRDLQTLERLYKDRSLRFLDVLTREPQSILVADGGAGLETALVAITFPAASILCATEDADGLVRANVGSLPNVRICSASAPCSMDSPHSTAASMPAEEASGAGQATGKIGIVLLSAETDWAALKAAGFPGAEELAAADMLIVDSGAWQMPLEPRSAGPFQHHKRAFFMGWDIFTPPQSKPFRGALQQNLPGQIAHAQRAVKVFYHVAAKDHYRSVVLEHMSRLLFSGLYDRAEGIYCFVLAETAEAAAEASRLLQSFGAKVHVAQTSTDMSQFERFTLTGLRAHLAPTDVFLYMHTKGLRHDVSNLNIYWWSFYMQYFLLREHERCIELLRRWDTVGVDWNEARPAEGVRFHYSGNFWWARADYYLRMDDNIGGGYLDPEFYIGSGDNGRHFTMWQSQNDMYKAEYPPRLFTDAAPFVRHWLTS